MHRITRIFFLIGIYQALHIICGDKLVDEWVSLANKNAIFAGLTRFRYRLSGGLMGMQTVRKLLDARRLALPLIAAIRQFDTARLISS